jgi:hypothetical protein
MPGDVLPIKRRGFGFINNLQVVAGILGTEPLSYELIKDAIMTPSKNRGVGRSRISELDIQARERKEKLIQVIMQR